jgi:hypothetical protein
MKNKPRRRKETYRPKAVPIRTTILDLLHTLSELTKDDRMVLSAFKSIFDSYNVRLAHSLAPVRLVGDTARNPTQHKKTL